MMSFSAAYIPVGVPTFHLESAQDQFDRSVALLKGIDERFVCPEKMLLTLDDLHRLNVIGHIPIEEIREAVT